MGGHGVELSEPDRNRAARNVAARVVRHDDVPRQPAAGRAPVTAQAAVWLQRAAGNRAVARMLAPDEPATTAAAPRAAAPAPAVQRLMGIEAEMSIPTWTPAPVMGTPTQTVEGFLTGGMQEGTQLQGAAGGFSIETDHDQIKTEVENQRVYYDTRIPGGLAPRNPGFLVGNLEYKTDPPCDEQTPAGRLAFRNSVVGMVADMNNRWANRFAPAALGPGMVGAPSAADYQHFGTTHHNPGLGVTAAGTAVPHAALSARIRRPLYIQFTAGITPRRIVRHLRLARQNANVMTANNTANPNLVMDLVTTGAIATARAALDNAAGLTGTQRGSTSLFGFLSLIVSYLHGSYLVRGADLTDIKNIAFFLSKTPLSEFQLELAANRRPDQMAAPVRANLVNQIINRVVARMTQPDVTPFWQAPPVNGTHDDGALGTWRANWLPEILGGTEDSFSAAGLAGRVIAAGDHARSKTIVSGGAIAGSSDGLPAGPGQPPIDRPAARSAPNAVRSGAIPLEFRHIEATPDPNALLPLVNQLITHVRRANR